jgi:hypothetical protein
MASHPEFPAQTHRVLAALCKQLTRWQDGPALARRTGLTPDRLHPILSNLAARGLAQIARPGNELCQDARIGVCLRFLDSAGPQTLITAHTALGRDGTILIQAAPSSAVAKILEITGARQLLAIRSALSQAMADS